DCRHSSDSASRLSTQRGKTALQLMKIFRIIGRFSRLPTLEAKDSAMTRMPLATASLLALAISLAGCGDDKKEAAAPQAQAPAAANTEAPATAAANKVDE